MVAGGQTQFSLDVAGQERNLSDSALDGKAMGVSPVNVSGLIRSQDIVRAEIASRLDKH